MTYAEFASYIRLQTKTNTTTFTDADIMLYANIFKDELAKRIVRVRDDYFGVPELTNLEVDGSSVPVREIALDPTTFQQVKYVEIKLDSKWVPMKELDLVHFRGTTDEEYITANFGNTEGRAKYDLFRGSLWLYTGTFVATTNGLKLWTFQWPAKITSLAGTDDMSIDPTNTSAGMPREFHELLARRVIIAKKSAGDKPIPLVGNELTYGTDLQIALAEISRAQVIHGEIEDKATDRWDNGFNL